MKISKAKAQRDGNTIKAEVDGVEMIVPVDPGNRHYRALLDAAITIEEADPEPVVEAPLSAEELFDALKAQGVISGTVDLQVVKKNLREKGM
jgi:uncharacterized protein (DUF342 family)